MSSTYVRWGGGRLPSSIGATRGSVGVSERREVRIVSRGAPAFKGLQLYEPAASGGGRGGVGETQAKKARYEEIYVLPSDMRQ
jgi:hypothetical protein